MSELESIPGIGQKTITYFNKLDINNMEDLITYYPFRYNYLKQVDVREVDKESDITITGVVQSVPSLFFFRGRQNKMSFTINSSNLILQVSIFNRGYLKKNIEIGKEILITGKYNPLKQTIMAHNLRFNDIKDEDIIEPVYHTVNGLKNKVINNIIKKMLLTNTPKEVLPPTIEKKYDFMNRKKAVNIVHDPKDISLLERAKSRLKYEELFLFMLKINKMILSKEKDNTGLARKFKKEKVDNFIADLPFQLTTDQNNTLTEILTDLKSKKRMNRLLLGDVGSGKTIVAVAGIYANFLGGYQSALMAPTEILANQHFESIKEILKKYNIEVALLTGSTKTKEKKQIYEDVTSGKINLLIGTHALINDKLIFNNLGLVITDEQHRFGVNQRANLKNKSIAPDVLYLSATPIPRTYALTIYGDMDISTIKEAPKGRKKIVTKIKRNKQIKEVLFHILEEVKKNHQIYIISPLIEDDEETELESVNKLKENIDIAFKGKIRSEILHGRMKSKEKAKVMEDFSAKKFPILISTTVVEVGVDIKNATMIVVFNAERFGLSTLHQLRGRVGRNDLQSYCYLVTDSRHERLKVLEQESSGFEISEADFKLRGAGNVFGTIQSGDMIFKIADLKEDYDILLKAKDDAMEILKKDDISDIIKKELESSHDLA